jgi:hypothetical protein
MGSWLKRQTEGPADFGGTFPPSETAILVANRVFSLAC